METEAYKIIIANIRNAIDESGYKQKVVAVRAGMTPRQLNDILCFRKRLDAADIPVFCVVLNISPARIFEGAIA